MSEDYPQRVVEATGSDAPQGDPSDPDEDATVATLVDPSLPEEEAVATRRPRDFQ